MKAIMRILQDARNTERKWKRVVGQVGTPPPEQFRRFAMVDILTYLSTAMNIYNGNLNKRFF